VILETWNLTRQIICRANQSSVFESLSRFRRFDSFFKDTTFTMRPMCSERLCRDFWKSSVVARRGIRSRKFRGDSDAAMSLGRSGQKRDTVERCCVFVSV
jgi:hypothetical protein